MHRWTACESQRNQRQVACCTEVGCGMQAPTEQQPMAMDFAITKPGLSWQSMHSHTPKASDCRCCCMTECFHARHILLTPAGSHSGGACNGAPSLCNFSELKEGEDLLLDRTKWALLTAGVPSYNITLKLMNFVCCCTVLPEASWVQPRGSLLFYCRCCQTVCHTGY